MQRGKATIIKIGKKKSMLKEWKNGSPLQAWGSGAGELG